MLNDVAARIASVDPAAGDMASQAAAAMDRATGGAQKKRPSKTCDDTLGANASPGAAAAGGMAAGAQRAVEETKGPQPGQTLSSQSTLPVDREALDAGSRDTLSYQQPGKKATTILSPHLETISYGSMMSLGQLHDLPPYQPAHHRQDQGQPHRPI